MKTTLNLLVAMYCMCPMFTAAQTDPWAEWIKQSETISTTTISYRSVEIIEYSKDFTYRSGSYTPYSPPGFSERALATLQARYDYYHSIISKEYYKLKNLELINKQNQSTLLTYQQQRLGIVYKAASTSNLGIPDTSQKIIGYCCEIYSNKNIKAELDLLNSIRAEIARMKVKDPDNFYKSDRYKEMSTVLDKLAKCNPDEITQIAFQYGLTSL